MIILTGFADEISPELDEQLDVLAAEGITHLELRSVWGKNVLKLSEEEAQRIKQTLDARGVRVSAIGSPIGKISITDDFAPHLQDFQRAVEMAKLFGTKNIRLFSFYTREVSPEEVRDEVIQRMKQLTAIAEANDILLLHENEKHIYGDIPARCADLLQSCASEHLRAAFDPANFIQCGVRPMSEAYPLLEQDIAYVHVKDALLDTGRVVPAGEGDGQWRELLAALKQRNYSGYMSLEPHLKAEQALTGLSKPELFVVAVRALKQRLEEAGLSWQ